MATLNITTNKTRAQMVTELTNWADATQVSGNGYVWACADNITVTAEIELYGFTLIFASGKRIVANAGGNIKVSINFLEDFNLPSTICIKGIKRQQIDFVSGTGKWTGRGLTIKTDKAWPCFNSSTSQTNITHVSIDAITEDETYTHFLLHANGQIILSRLTGIGFQFGVGHYGTSVGSSGVVSSAGYGGAILWVNTNSLTTAFDLNGFTVNHNSANKFSSHFFNTISFIDSNVNPDNMLCGPRSNANVVRKIKRNVKLLPSTTTGTAISGFKFRVSSKRIANPGNVVTDNFTIAGNVSGDFNDNYLLTAWNGSTAIGTGTYGTLRDTLNDKDMRIQFRKYGFLESFIRGNSYFGGLDAKAIMENDTFIQAATPPSLSSTTTAAQFYDGVRSLVAGNFALPDDLLTTDGETLTIKTGWSLGYNTVNTNLSILTSNNKILIGKDSYIGKMNTGRFKYSKLSGSVSSFMSTHTDLTFARDDGKANLNLQITCPPGSKDPVAGVWLFSQGLDNRAGMITGQTTGTGVTNISLQVSATAKYYCTAKALGSNQYTPFVIEPVGGLGGSRDITLFVYEKNDGTPLLPTTLTPAQTAIADTFEFHTTHIDIKIPTGFSTNSRWSSTDKIWQYKAEDFIPIAYKLDVIQTALILLGRNQLMFLQEGRILISAATNAKILEQDPANKTTVGSTTNIKVSLTTISMGRIGDTDARNTFIDNSNGAIDVRGGVPINGGFSIADANRLVIVETKANETHQRLALDSAKPLTNKPDGGITSTGITIVATELADGSIKQTRS